MAAAAASRKRPASNGACPSAAAAKKRARYQFRSIHDYEQLGEGTYGSVLKARDRRTGETVAVKRLRGGLRAAVRQAGCLAACRGHPSVVQIRDVAAAAATGDLFLVTEFVASASLRRRLIWRRRFTEPEARASMRQLLGAAAWLHGAGTIHRDINPDNVLAGPGGALKLCDFGRATPARPAGGMPYPPEEEEEHVGVLQYRSPEQLIGTGRCYGPAVDVWALGCVMAELLAGKPLFTADTEDDMLAEILDLHDGIVSMGLEAFDDDLPELSPAGREVLAGLLSYHDDERLTAAYALKHRWFTEEAEPPAVDAKQAYPGFVPLFSLLRSIRLE